MSPSDLALCVVRGAHLLGLALAARSLSPEPLPPASLPLAALGSVFLFTAIGVGALAFRRFMETRAATAAAVLAFVAIATALVCSFIYRGPAAPLARGAPLVAVPAWGALAAAASTAGGRWLGSSFKYKRMSAATLVLAIGAKLLVDAAPFLGSTERMWRAAAKRAPDHELAVTEAGRLLLGRDRVGDARKLADRCLEARPTACACLALRAEVASRAAEPVEAVRTARAAADACRH